MSNYHVHDFLSFSIKNGKDSQPTRSLWLWISKQYESFLCSSEAHPDLEVQVGPFQPEISGCYILDDKCYVARDYLYSTIKYKFTKFEFDITGWEGESLRMRVSCNLPGFLMVTALVIDPLLLYALIQRQVLPVHAACIADGKGAYLFAGSSGTGKTSICLDLMGDGYNLLGDNYTLFSNGRVYGFLSPLNIFTYNLTPALTERVSRATLVALRVKGLLWRATGGYIKVFTKINPVRLWPGQTACTQAVPRAIFLLVKSNRLQIDQVSPEDLAAALVANMRLEIPTLLQWLAQYSFVNSGFSVPRWLAWYETCLTENLSQVPHLLRVEVPEADGSSNAESMRSLIEGVQDH